MKHYIIISYSSSCSHGASNSKSRAHAGLAVGINPGAAAGGSCLSGSDGRCCAGECECEFDRPLEPGKKIGSAESSTGNAHRLSLTRSPRQQHTPQTSRKKT
ncbi:unnamed protein product, partial [Meganyctiphanes norvegica]